MLHHARQAIRILTVVRPDRAGMRCKIHDELVAFVSCFPRGECQLTRHPRHRREMPINGAIIAAVRIRFCRELGDDLLEGPIPVSLPAEGRRQTDESSLIRGDVRGAIIAKPLVLRDSGKSRHYAAPLSKVGVPVVGRLDCLAAARQLR